MKLDAAHVRKIAQLARLSVTDAETEALLVHMNRMLDYVAQLSEVDTSKVPPLEHAVEMDTPLRDDEPVRKFDASRGLENAPAAELNMFRVPKVVE
ncbi:MAG: Asp-tRNA(Asn)/Glu-tRNA(Gln) amidotransferase subunit GatC [Deltaproteobacteria bacterium]|nr:Asp-tRNA(Asn)/Glu-tRNA(Gln) amidotransferase subunit GatC [Deltaproteobacteria bacterium]